MTDQAERHQKIYAIAAGPDGPCKIGKAFDPQGRLTALQTGHPEELQLFWSSHSCSGAAILERYLHEHFAAKRLTGEWFAVTVEEAGFAINMAIELGDVICHQRCLDKPVTYGALIEAVLSQCPKLTEDDVEQVLGVAACFGFGTEQYRKMKEQWYGAPHWDKSKPEEPVALTDEYVDEGDG